MCLEGVDLIHLNHINLDKVQSCEEENNKSSQGLCTVSVDYVFVSSVLIQVMHLSFHMVLSSAITCKCAVYGSLELLRPLSTRLGVI